MPHFFINSNSIENNSISIKDEELLNHLVKSLRLKEGERLLLFDENKIRYETKIKSVSKKEITTEIEKKYPSQRFIDYEIYLAPSIIKQDGFNELISGVTQLGIKGLYPLYTDNTAVSKSQIENKTQKWQKISDESVKQCERADFMKIFETSTLQNFDYSMFDKIIVFSEIEEKNTIKSISPSIKKTDRILVITGPEGGFSSKEFDFFKEKNFCQVKISNLILKAQTACISGISNLIYELSEWKTTKI